MSTSYALLKGLTTMIELSWYDDEQRVLLYRFPPHWEWDDFYAVKQIADGWLDEVPHADPVLLLLDMSASRKMPRNALSRARALIQNAHPRGYPLVFISSDPLLHAVGDILRRLLPQLTDDRFVIVPNARQAKRVIRQYVAVR